MFSSTRKTLCLLVVLSTAICLQAQTSTQKVGTASVSGKVTIKGKPAIGVIVVAGMPEHLRTSTSPMHRTRTDETGSYSIRNLSPGSYEISTFTPALVSNDMRSVVLSEGEQVEDVNLALVPGGVIAGKITDSEGKPVIAQHVKIMPVFDSPPMQLSPHMLTRLFIENTTDDRGIYRAFGVPPGKYKVSVGESGGLSRGPQQRFAETFYPSVTDVAKATTIEVTEGSEKTGVDITMGRLVQSFRVSGRVVDGETGKPIPNVTYGVEHRTTEDGASSGASSSFGGEATNANGEFRLDNVSPGAYTVFTFAMDGSDAPPGSVSFEVTDHDVTDLIIKTKKGASLSGLVVVEGDKKAATMLGSMRIQAIMEGTEPRMAPSQSAAVGQDGTFRISGLPGGRVRLTLDFSIEGKEFSIARIERNGMPSSETINVKESENITGVRVVLKALKLTGSIRGQLKVEDGELPPVSQLGLLLLPLDENLQPKRQFSIPPPQLDARGRFLSEGLPAGTYRVYVYGTGSPNPAAPWTTQDVIVTDDNVTEVTLTLKRRP